MKRITAVLATLGLLLTVPSKAQPYLKIDLPQPNLFVTTVTDVAEDANGDLYIGTDGGLLIKTQSGVSYDMIDSVSDAMGNYWPIRITCVELVRGKVWVGTEASGAYYLQNGNWVNLNTTHGMPSNKVNAITEGGTQFTYLACNGGIARFSGSVVTVLKPFANNQIIELVDYHGGFLYASNHRRNEPIKKFSGSIWVDVDSMPASLGGVGQNRAQQILFGPGNQLTIRTTNGNNVVHFDGQNWSSVYNANVLGITKNPIGIDILQVIPEMYYLQLNNGVLDTIAIGLAPAGGIAKPAKAGGFWLGGSTGSTPLLYYIKGTKNNFATLHANQIKADFSSYGGLFERNKSGEDPNYYRFFYTDTANRGLAHASSLWLKGTVNGQVRISADVYLNGPTDFMSGPVSQVYNVSYLEKFDRVWKVNKAEINHHRNHYATQGYKVPESLKSWPGNGDSALGTAPILAPFVDINANGLYEPQFGDYPQIKGDQAVFFMFNDVRGRHEVAGGKPIGLEIHGMAYAYDSIDAVLENSFFINYKIINRSGTLIQGLKPALATLHAISTRNVANISGNDAPGSDNRKSLTYFYNMINNDPYYGSKSPAFGLVGLSDSLTGNMGLEVYASAPTGSPRSFAEFNNLFNFKWLDGSDLLLENPSGYGSALNGDGYHPPGSFANTTLHYDYNSNWFKSPQTAATRLSLSFYKKTDLQPGESRCLDLAFTVTPSQGANTQLAMINSLRAAADSLKAFYQSDTSGCLEYKISLPESEIAQKADFSIYPNPAQAELNIKVAPGVKIEQIEVFALSGRKVMAQLGSSHINVAELSAGIYLLQLQTNVGRLNERFIIQ